MKALVLLSFFLGFALADHALLRANHAERVRQTSYHLQAMRAQVHSTMEDAHSFVLLDATTDCIAAGVAFATIWNSSCGVVSEVWDNSTTADRLDEVLTTYCEQKDANQMTCQQKVPAAFANYVSKCYSIGMVNKTQLREAQVLLTASSITCLTDDTDAHYCIKDFIALQHLGDPITADKLDVACSKCVEKVLNAFDKFATKELVLTSIWLKLICYELNGERCILKFQDAITAPKEDPPSDALLNKWCDPCTVAFVARHVVAIAILGGNETAVMEEANFLRLTRYICVTDWNGKHCFPQLMDAQTQADFAAMGLKCATSFQGAHDTCSDDCSHALADIHTKLGCCFGTWFNFLEWQSQDDPAKYTATMPAPPDALRTFVGDTCKVPVPLGCGQQKIVVSLVIANVKWDWYQANADQVKQDLKNYLAYLLAIDAAAVGAINIVEAKKGVKVSTHGFSPRYQLLGDVPNGIAVDTSIQPADNSQGTAVVAGVNGAAQSTNPVFVSTWGLDSREDPNSDVTLTTAEAKAQTSGGFAVTPSVLTFLFIALAYFPSYL